MNISRDEDDDSSDSDSMRHSSSREGGERSGGGWTIFVFSSESCKEIDILRPSERETTSTLSRSVGQSVLTLRGLAIDWRSAILSVQAMAKELNRDVQSFRQTRASLLSWFSRSSMLQDRGAKTDDPEVIEWIIAGARIADGAITLVKKLVDIVRSIRNKEILAIERDTSIPSKERRRALEATVVRQRGQQMANHYRIGTEFLGCDDGRERWLLGLFISYSLALDRPDQALVARLQRFCREAREFMSSNSRFGVSHSLSVPRISLARSTTQSQESYSFVDATSSSENERR